jgi:membrane protein YdbS with pleckstrin-like domain
VVTDIEAAFAPPDESWIRVSSKLATAYRINASLVAVLLLVGLGALLLIPGFPVVISAALAGVVLVVFVWAWWLFGRRTRSWGYAERSDDLLVTSGIMFRRLVIVPYGRMQLVDLKAGPLHRMLGIATVQLHTAAATTDASIPGLAPGVAADLRDRLARRGEQRSAGL